MLWVVKLKGCNILSLFYICCFMTLNFFSTSILGTVSACRVMLCAAFWRKENYFLAQMSHLKFSGC